jgi:hypothetical protein
MIKQKNLRGQAFAAASESKQIAHRERTNTTWKTLIERSGTTPQVPWNYDEKSDTATQCQRLQRTKAYYGAFMDMTADFVDCNSNELEARMAGQMVQFGCYISRYSAAHRGCADRQTLK